VIQAVDSLSFYGLRMIKAVFVRPDRLSWLSCQARTRFELSQVIQTESQENDRPRAPSQLGCFTQIQAIVVRQLKAKLGAPAGRGRGAVAGVSA